MDVQLEDDERAALSNFSQLAKSRARLMVQGRRTARAKGADDAAGGMASPGVGAECCAICLNDLTTALAALLHTPCAHTFHAPCFAALLKQRLYTCPLCRSDLQPALRLAPPTVGLRTVGLRTVGLPTSAPESPSLPALFSLGALGALGAGGTFGAAWVHIIADDDVSLEDIRYLLTLLVQEPIL